MPREVISLLVDWLIVNATQPRASIATFEDLDVWKICVGLRNAISSLAKTLPPEEKFRLADQMIRASRSVTANIGDGFGRFHYQESIQFCRQARSSLYELSIIFTLLWRKDIFRTRHFGTYETIL